MTPEQFIPFWNALTINERNRIKENLQTAANPGSGFFSSKRFMKGGIVFLLQGNLRIFLSSDEGREITVMTMKAGENFLVHPGDASHSRKGQLRYETSDNCEYAFLPRNVMVEVMGRCPEALEYVLDSEEQLLRRLTDSLSYSAFVTVRGNLARTLLERSELKGKVRLTHEELANELGTTRVVISRELKKMEEFGLIKLGRGEIEILYRDGLRELAE
ncbi:MAG: Crp/Fnr family transcriptional regulator [Clostridia bacterium]|nr:Crp/Fnr family transcriptional regulator [Clostridia bacterium]MBQ3327703.1 Crp/Fnr family transcriptional regulator [Clostridia bacterium]MBQ6445707.1 Crp/Fnr family transcriptional regulator [Clostridia bacterium]MBR0363856.1 Crp/Fnr family transcriptional regulator [Clostridia bacterium]